jgi:hypothetical protein
MSIAELAWEALMVGADTGVPANALDSVMQLVQGVQGNDQTPIYEELGGLRNVGYSSRRSAESACPQFYALRL